MKNYFQINNENKENQIKSLKSLIEHSDTVLVGAGAGLSTAAGLTYSGERFKKYFFDFEKTFGIQDMYTGGFYPFPTEEVKWAWWARHIYFNRYIEPPKMVYKDLLSLLKDKNYFVITTNVDHQFQRAGFDKNRLFYTQGDYGLFQSTNRRNRKTYDNEVWVKQAMEAQGFIKDKDGNFQVPENKEIKMSIPRELLPVCDEDGYEMTTNLRVDASFVEDEGWHEASKRYQEFLDRTEKGKILYLELGVGANTPGIIKYPFWRRVFDNPEAIYVCLNYGESICPKEIKDRSLCIDADIAELLVNTR